MLSGEVVSAQHPEAPRKAGRFRAPPAAKAAVRASVTPVQFDGFGIGQDVGPDREENQQASRRRARTSEQNIARKVAALLRVLARPTETGQYPLDISGRPTAGEYNKNIYQPESQADRQQDYVCCCHEPAFSECDRCESGLCTKFFKDIRWIDNAIIGGSQGPFTLT
eukprot:gnl/TRDRNA2_/TRDRNA2_90159_c0_seq1.p1 gnl/TRDRNA2_/TRDRNA2_90159_c0~~gnl/TRDRNA2_/TRDRNA2_90159_c0_seq1.p1  ORF type:complete len:167 (-),score=15.53 gnl/TRDRNA2_/TRDRNA2_90159_c0_seq1:58-558(-)